MKLERALDVPGWMTPIELKWLAEQASKHEIIIEMGSLLGRSTIALAENTSGIVVAVDNFHGVNNDLSFIPYVQGLFLKYIEGIKNIKVLQINHEDFEPIPADMVFIDGGHEYENVKRDIQKWLNYKNLFLCGHDINDPTHPGVTKAVKELLPNYQVVENTAIWYQQL